MDSPEEMRENEAEEHMDVLEAQLRKALARVDAPPNFMAMVMERAETAQVSKAKPGAPRLFSMPKPWRWMMSPWAGGAVAAMLVAGVFLTGEHVHQVHVKQAQATQQFEQATQITDRALQRAREKMRKAGVDLDQ